MSSTDLSALSWDTFHFLRPQWLWLLPLLAVITLFILLTQREKTKWKKLIASPLRKYMFSKGRAYAMVWPLATYVLAVVFGVLALAGPSWQYAKKPEVEHAAVLGILLDLSWSMNTADVQPTRLERAKLKVRDLMKANPGARTSLTVFAGTPHTVLPLTSDYKLITHHADHLESGIMPVRGDNVGLAMQMMDSIFQRIEAPSTLLLFIDEMEPEDLQYLFAFVDHSPHRIEMVVMSTPAGGEVPGFSKNTMLTDQSGSRVVSYIDPILIAQLADHQKITINHLTLDTSDMEAIAGRVRRALTFQAADDASEDLWKDEGVLFLLPCLLFSLLFFRKGWMIQWCVVFLMVACSPTDPMAKYWYTPDYLGQMLESEQKYQMAGDSYEDLNHKAVAYYKAGDYDAAAGLFALDSSSTGLYNYALAQSKLGNFESAAEALKLAIQIDPDLEQAGRSLSKVEQAMKQQDSIARYGPKEVPDTGSKAPLEERKTSGKDEELSTDTEADELPQNGDRVTDEVETQIHKAEELQSPPETEPQHQDQGMQDILLRKVSAVPSEFLRRRFQMQKERYYSDVKEGKKKY